MACTIWSDSGFTVGANRFTISPSALTKNFVRLHALRFGLSRHILAALAVFHGPCTPPLPQTPGKSLACKNGPFRGPGPLQALVLI